MARREKQIARSIAHAILHNTPDGKPPKKPTILGRALRLLHLYWLTFELLRTDLFQALRDAWGIGSADYKDSFTGTSIKALSEPLVPLGDMGYSGSTFFRTRDAKYVVKSVPRRFENTFFKKDLMVPYADYMRANLDSILVHITDFLQSRHKCVGMLLGLAPSHHIIMENLLHGQGEDESAKWESWDLKPMSYFFPERDVAGGALASEATKSKLADEFNDKILLTRAQLDGFLAQLEKDTQLLADANAVDYSLFLVRVTRNEDYQARSSHTEAPISAPNPPSWHTGVPSANGQEIYRAAILDFFWSKHSVQAKAMTGLVKTYNVIDEQGPMSITAESKEYRQRFLKMCAEIVQVVE